MGNILGFALGSIMKFCYQFTHNYGFAIILFTVATKVILFPISLWVHTNGIKMVRIQPAINRLEIRYFGDQDKIADERLILFKKEKHSPFAGTIPIIVQLILLIGLIQVIYHPLSFVLRLPESDVATMMQAAHQFGGVDLASSSAELMALDFFQQLDNAPILIAQNISHGTFDIVQSMDMTFLGLSVTSLPLSSGGISILVPLLAGVASIILSLSQNKLNPLQKEQGKLSQLSSMLFSVVISLGVGFFVPIGIGLYWIWSNLFSIVQQYILNLIHKPSKYIDYAELEASKQALDQYQRIDGPSKEHQKGHIKREKQDYKRFFSIANKHIVFYSESSGFYKYFQHVIQYLLTYSNMIIHYVTSDPSDQIFDLAEKEPKIRPYYISEKKLITLLMKIEADVVVMTMSDLENYHYKRSYMSKEIEYVYLFHYPLSTHMVLHTGALNHYDTIFCVGEFQFYEIRKTEELYGLPSKNLVLSGYGQLESLYDSYQKMTITKRAQPKVLIAPSWQEGNILDTCIDTLLAQLLGKGFAVVIRPHPEYVKRYGIRMDEVMNRYSMHTSDDLTFELDFTSNSSIFDSDIVITDWSGTAYEFSLATLRPSVFIDTPPKIHNPEYTKLGIEPLEFSLRDQIGIRIDPNHMDELASKMKALLDDSSYEATIGGIRDHYIANFGSSGEVGGKYLIKAIKQKIEKRQ